MSMALRAILLLAACLGVVLAHGGVVPFNRASLEEATSGDRAVFVKFFAPWCGYCQEMAPTWANFAHEVGDDAVIGEVDCTKQSELCAEKNLRGFPTVDLFVNGEAKRYYGSRTSVSEMVAFLYGELGQEGPPLPRAAVEVKPFDPAHVVELDANNFDAHVWAEGTWDFEGATPWIVLFYSKACPYSTELMNMWSEVGRGEASAWFGRSFHVAAFDMDAEGSTDFARRYQIKGAPTMLMLARGDDIPYSGPRNAAAVREFVQANKDGLPRGDSKAARIDGHTLELNDWNWKKLTRKSYWLIIFHSPRCKFCKAVESTIQQIAANVNTNPPMAGMLVGKFNAVDHKRIPRRFGVTKYPTITFVAEEKVVSVYHGARTTEDMQKWFEAEARKFEASKHEHDEL